MEEKVNMEEENKKVSTKPEVEQPSYEQLKNWCDQLLMQRNQAIEKLRQITDVLNKLPWLFKVLEHKDVFPETFVDDCIKEVTYIMTPPVEEDNKANPEESKE